uniref:Uncharacterized protein n=1 Tax=Micrurus surinamensis TaxID=129470 RepID=A0A2D4PGS3_MICSU
MCITDYVLDSPVFHLAIKETVAGLLSVVGGTYSFIESKSDLYIQDGKQSISGFFSSLILSVTTTLYHFNKAGCCEGYRGSQDSYDTALPKIWVLSWRIYWELQVL